MGVHSAWHMVGAQEMQPYSLPSPPPVEPGIPPGRGKGFPVKFPKGSASGTLKGNPPQSPIPLQFPNSPEVVATSRQPPPTTRPSPSIQSPSRLPQNDFRLETAAIIVREI